MITSAIEADIEFTRRDIFGEDGQIQLVVLAASFEDPALEPRIVAAMLGSHGVIVPSEQEPPS